METLWIICFANNLTLYQYLCDIRYPAAWAPGRCWPRCSWTVPSPRPSSPLLTLTKNWLRTSALLSSTPRDWLHQQVGWGWSRHIKHCTERIIIADGLWEKKLFMRYSIKIFKSFCCQNLLGRSILDCLELRYLVSIAIFWYKVWVLPFFQTCDINIPVVGLVLN